MVDQALDGSHTAPWPNASGVSTGCMGCMFCQDLLLGRFQQGRRVHEILLEQFEEAQCYAS